MVKNNGTWRAVPPPEFWENTSFVTMLKLAGIWASHLKNMSVGNSFPQFSRVKMKSLGNSTTGSTKKNHRLQATRRSIASLVVSTHLKNICPIGSSSQVGVDIKKCLKPPPSYVNANKHHVNLNALELAFRLSSWRKAKWVPKLLPHTKFDNSPLTWMMLGRLSDFWVSAYFWVFSGGYLKVPGWKNGYLPDIPWKFGTPKKAGLASVGGGCLKNTDPHKVWLEV